LFGQIVIGTIKRVEAAKVNPDSPRKPVRFVEVQHGFVWGNPNGAIIQARCGIGLEVKFDLAGVIITMK
jgi:hypothetical protein